MAVAAMPSRATDGPYTKGGLLREIEPAASCGLRCARGATKLSPPIFAQAGVGGLLPARADKESGEGKRQEAMNDQLKGRLKMSGKRFQLPAF